MEVPFKDEFKQEERELDVFREVSPQFWKYLMDDLSTEIRGFDNMMKTERDPWRRYALVETYTFLCNYKIKLMDYMEASKNPVTS